MCWSFGDGCWVVLVSPLLEFCEMFGKAKDEGCSNRANKRNDFGEVFVIRNNGET